MFSILIMLLNASSNSQNIGIKYDVMWVKANLKQDKCIEDIIFVQLSEMEEKYVRFQRVHIQKYVDS